MIVARIDLATPIPGQLWQSDNWALVYLEGVYAIFVRTSGADAELARQAALTADNWRPAEYVSQARSRELRPAYAMSAAGRLLTMLTWHDAAVEVLRQAVLEDAGMADAWFQLGAAHANRSIQRQRQSLPGADDDVRSAIDALRRGLTIRPDADAEALLGRLQHAGRAPLRAP
ncbi:MAG: hypothetical protein ACYTFO_11635 [Planctomycetota bacterium]